jgi:hypothetical protein
MAWACKLHVEPGPERIAHGEAEAGSRSYVWVYLRELPDADLTAAVDAACATWGFDCLEICESAEMHDAEVPEPARELFDQVGVGFGVFHSYPGDSTDRAT